MIIASLWVVIEEAQGRGGPETKQVASREVSQPVHQRSQIPSAGKTTWIFSLKKKERRRVEKVCPTICSTITLHTFSFILHPRNPEGNVKRLKRKKKPHNRRERMFASRKPNAHVTVVVATCSAKTIPPSPALHEIKCAFILMLHIHFRKWNKKRIKSGYCRRY